MKPRKPCFVDVYSQLPYILRVILLCLDTGKAVNEAYRRVDVCCHASCYDEAAISVIAV